MSNRIDQPLIFSIDDRLAEQHLTRLDLCSQNLKRIDKLPNNINFNIILLDQNEINKLEYLDIYPQLIQLSISHNRLTDIRLLNRLRSIQKLNLSYNLIDSIDCLRTLQNLVMLNISNNNIHSIAVLNACHALQSLDASENSIQHVEDLSHLTSLKYLNLHKNFIDTLISIPRYWPKSLHTLVISDNEIQDLTEISYISSFINLNTFYIADNPCLSVVNERFGCHQPFDYRPYILNWCLSIQNLDGIFITRKESLKAEWLLSQGKGRSFGPGEHIELVQYLTRVCGTDANERDDLHLSRIMFQQDLYNEQMMTTSDTIQEKFQQNTHISDSEFRKLNTSSSVSTVDEPRISQVSDTYCDNRPIKPLDQTMLQTKLNQYPVNNHLNNDNTNNSQRTSSQLTYNANRYSPKTTTRGPTTSSVLSTRSNRNLVRQRHNRVKRQTINSNNTNTVRSLNHSHDNNTHRLTTTVKVKTKEQQSSIRTSNDDKNQYINNNELHLKSTQCTTMSNSIELQKLTTSVETMRTSILQAYLDLHERFTKTTELQTSALTALWKKYETQNLTHQRETEKIIQENRLLNQRIHELETHLNITQLKSSNSISKQNPNLYPPLRAHISKRDTKSFFLHWIPNPLNEHRTILGYRIYIDDILKGSIDSGRFEAIIDYIRDEGEYKIKLRTYDEYGESADSNIVIARFRRQHSITPNSTETAMMMYRNQSDHIIDDTNQIQSNENFFISPREQIKTPIIMEPINDNIVTRKPPKSPTSSPIRTDKTTSPNNGSCSKVLFTNNDNDSPAIISTKRSPTRIGIRTRLAKSPHRLKQNNILLNVLPTEPTKRMDTSNLFQAKTIKRIIAFQPGQINHDHVHILAQQIPIVSPDISDSMNIHYLSTNSDTLSSNSSPPPIPPRMVKNTVKISYDQQS